MKKAISILGPTHCGKTELAIEINKHFPTKIISVDSVQVYKGANIGSSKPNQKILDSICLLYTSPSPRDTEVSRMPSSA